MSNNTTTSASFESILFNNTYSNRQHIGQKDFASVPVMLLTTDPTYQRTETTSEDKIKTLSAHFDKNKMDALVVSPHKEELKFVVVDGYHRLEAAKRNGIDSLECCILSDLIDLDPDTRRLREANIFATQDDDKEKLRPHQKHNASLICGVRENIILQETAEKYGFIVDDKQRRGDYAHPNFVTGFSAALRVAKSNRGCLDKTFYVIKKANWASCPGGLSSLTINSLSKVVLEYMGKKGLYSNMANILSKMEPEGYFARSRAKYPERKATESCVMWLTDELEARMGEL